VRSVLVVAGLDRAGVKPIDYNPAQDVTPPTWDPGALTPEEREDLKAYLVKMVREREAVGAHRLVSAVAIGTGINRLSRATPCLGPSPCGDRGERPTHYHPFNV
jgi:hypothetical protein